METTVTYSKLQYQGSSGSVLNIKYSKLILVMRCKKQRAGRKRKTIQILSLEVIQIQALLIARCMKYQLLPKSCLIFSFIRPFAEMVDKGQQGSLQPPTHAMAALPSQSSTLQFAEKNLRKSWKCAKYLHGSLNTVQFRKAKPSRKRCPKTGRDVGSHGYPNVFHSSATHYGS